MNSLMKMALSLSVSGSLLFFAVMGVVRLGQRRLSKAWQYYAWLLVAARLLIPVTTSVSLIGVLFAQSPALFPPATAAYHVQQVSHTVLPSAGGVIADQTAEGLARIPRSGWTDAAGWLWAVWILVALVLFIHKGITYYRFVSRTCAECAAVTSPTLLNQLESIREELGIRQKIHLYVDCRAPAPLVVGFFKPRIVLPSEELSEKYFRYVALHEVTHFRRGDQLYKWLMQLILCVHWFNPLVYQMAREVNRACELSCDEAVIRRLDADARYAYGDVLIHSLRHPGKRKQMLLGNALKENATAVKERLEAMMTYRKKSRAATLAGLALSALFAMAGLGLGVFVPDNAMAGSAAQESLRIIQADECMLLEGKDIFAYTSSELYTLWRNTFCFPVEASVRHVGFEADAFEDDPAGVCFSIDEAMDILTLTNEADKAKAREEVLSTPLRESRYPVVSVQITATSVAGPFGIEVGMTVDTLLSLLPEASKTSLNVDDDGFDTLYTARYRDENGAVYTIKAYSLMDMVSYCVINRE